MDYTGFTSSNDYDKHEKSKQYLVEKLDHAEMLIENIRREALKMAEDLDIIYNSVDAVRNSQLIDNLNDRKYLNCRVKNK